MSSSGAGSPSSPVGGSAATLGGRVGTPSSMADSGMMLHSTIVWLLGSGSSPTLPHHGARERGVGGG
eukprot:2685862-Prymnesium_polylepis.1